MNAFTSQSARALAAGAVCLAILSGMIVLHAWPLWTGASVILPVEPVDPRDMFRGEYVRLATPATRLSTRPNPDPSERLLVVTPLGEGWAKRTVPPAVIYVQLERAEGSGEWAPVSVSLDPVQGRTNLRGRVVHYDTSSEELNVDYGLDRFYMQEGTARPVEDAIRSKKRVQLEVAVASSGRARIRRLLIDGVPVGQ
jgi:uncharacterized membrane-anchored protein